MFMYVKKYIENDFNFSNNKCMQIKLLTFCKKIIDRKNRLALY